MMRVLMWLGLAVAASVLAAACATGPTQGSLAITTQIDFSGEAPHGTFEVTEGADVLGCSGGSFVDSPTERGLHKEFTCESGAKTGTFIAQFSPPSGPWKIVDATEDFGGLSGEGDFSVAPASEIDEETAVPSLDAETRAAVIDDLLSQLKENYVFVDVAAKMEENVRERQSKGEYDGITDRAAFADALTSHLREVSRDKHLEVIGDDMGPPPPGVETFTGDIRTEPEDPNATGEDVPPNPPTSAEGPSGSLYRTEHLPGGVGYMEVPGFPPPESGAGAAAASAMNELNDTDALIFDLTQNGGGDPATIALICSYLFGSEPVHLNDLRWRVGDNFEVEEFWTQPEVDGERYGEDKPVYVLTSNDTFSGGEEFVYDLQALGRATIVGETTGGGANPGGSFELAADFMVGIPTGTAVNPITKTNWEGTGVKPDIAVPRRESTRNCPRYGARGDRSGRKQTTLGEGESRVGHLVELSRELWQLSRHSEQVPPDRESWSDEQERECQRKLEIEMKNRQSGFE